MPSAITATPSPRSHAVIAPPVSRASSARGELAPEHEHAAPPLPIVADPLRGWHRVLRDARETDPLEELRRPLVDGAREHGDEPAPVPLVEERVDEPLAEPLALEPRDRVEPDDLADALLRVRRGEQRRDAREMAVADRRAVRGREHLRDLVAGAELEQALALPALEEALALREFVEAERPHAT